MKKENKGVTLISLAITVAVLIILASIATYSGVEVIRKSKLDNFTIEMETMQAEVNSLYQKANGNETVEINGNTYTGSEIYNIGKDLDSQASKVFKSGASGITDSTGYRIYDQDIIKELGIDSVEEKFFINIQTRSVVSYDGLEYEGTVYYTLNQLPNGLYNVEYENRNTGKPTFSVSGTTTSGITVSNIQYDGYIDKWKVKYQKEGQDYWSTSEELNFEVEGAGTYKIKLVNGDIESEVATVEVEKIVTAKEIKASSYGAEVKGYECELSGVNGWLLFYAGTMGEEEISNIYLIADEYIPYANIPYSINSSGTTTSRKPNRGSSTYARSAYFTNILTDYAGTSRIKDNVQILNNSYFSQGFTSTNNNMKSVAYMLDTETWSGFAGSDATYAIGGPTVEMLMKSYSEKYNVNYKANADTKVGYQISTDGGTNWKDLLDTSENLKNDDKNYVINTTENANGYWLASPSSYNGSQMFIVNSNR